MHDVFGDNYDFDREIPDAYPLFEDVVKKRLFQLLEDVGQQNRLTCLFSFFEMMAISSDQDVIHLLLIAILRPLVYDQEGIVRACKHMGSRTKALTISEARHQGRLENLPLG